MPAAALANFARALLNSTTPVWTGPRAPMSWMPKLLMCGASWNPGERRNWLLSWVAFEALGLVEVDAVGLGVAEGERCEVSPVSLDHVLGIADDYQTSPVATAIRFVELTPERCAVVLSQAGTVRWAVRSETFWPEITRGQGILQWSLAHSYFARGQLDASADMVDASAWIDGTRLRGPADIHEHAMPLPQLGAVMSLLWIPESCEPLAHRRHE
jgi:hypothetical protein